MSSELSLARARGVLAGAIALVVLAGCSSSHRNGEASSSLTTMPSSVATSPASTPTPSTARLDAGRPTVETIQVSSPDVGGRGQGFYVFLPPSYARDVTTRYPVLYLLHGVVGIPQSYLSVTEGAVQEASLIRRGEMKPVILVVPIPPWNTDSEWANGVRSGDAWETFVARDVVNAVDARFRTIRQASGRGIGGLSQGGYEAINIALHNPKTFGFVESWSGYSVADQRPSVFGNSKQLIDYNSPLVYIDQTWQTIRAAHIYFWLYIGALDDLRAQNRDFVAKLNRYEISNTYFEVPGQGHGWILWAHYTSAALIAASAHLAHA